MSPIAHTALGLFGWQLYAEKKNLRTLLLFTVIASLPDIDFALFLFMGKEGLSLHQVYTHNVTFVFLTALLLWPLLDSKRERLGFLLVAFSHLFLDVLTIDEGAPQGFRFFYPMSEKLYNLSILPNLRKGNLAEVFSLHNLTTVCFEIIVFVLPLMLLYRKAFAGYLHQKEFMKFK
jgi:membrane-bound metal-dependent hydrolase YbcI (DUF457 family)